MNYTPDDVRNAIDGLRSKLGRKEDIALQQAFDAGLQPNLLAYGKLGEVMPELPILEKYLAGATSFLHQPSKYYDIFRACRCVNVVQWLNTSLETLSAKKAKGLEPRLERLTKEVDHDAFDAVMFELTAAARYAEQPTAAGLEFIAENPQKKTPDFVVRVDGAERSVECKKIDRAANFTVLIRNAVRDHLNEVIASFRRKGVSVLAEVTFNCDPQEVDRTKLVRACQEALDTGTRIIEGDFNVSAVRLAPWRSPTYTLNPSGFFNWERYGFRIRSEWFGIVSQFIGSMGKRAGLPSHLQGGTSSWINEIDWDAAVKWKVSSEEVVARYRRFAFDGVFKGFEQLKGAGPDSTIHLWLETDYSVGARQETMRDLFRRIYGNGRDVFGWVLINETLFDISPKGHFDVIEHSHYIRGPSATTKDALGCLRTKCRAEARASSAWERSCRTLMRTEAGAVAEHGRSVFVLMDSLCPRVAGRVGR